MTSSQPTNFNQPQSLVKYSNPVLVSSSGKKQIKVFSILDRIISQTLEVLTLKIYWTQFYLPDNTLLRNNNYGILFFTKDSICLSYSSNKTGCFGFTIKTWQKIATTPGEGNRNLSNQRRAIFTMFWWANSTDYDQLCWEGFTFS